MHGMYGNAFRVIALVLAVTFFVGIAEAASLNQLPPLLYREVPIDNVNLESRADDPDDYRLPNTTEPLHYDVELFTQVHTGERAVTGTVKIELRVVEETHTIVLHARQLTVNSLTIRNLNDTSAAAIALTHEHEAEREFLTISPVSATTNFTLDVHYELTITYSGQLRTDNGGFYLSTYTDDAGQVHNLATTQFESTDARHGFPCYDEPAKRALFTITIHHDASYNAISNMPVDAAKSSAGITAFQTTVNMPTYLVAFIVSDFVWTEGVLESLPQRIYSRPGTGEDQEFALVSGMLLTARLAEYYGVNFTLPKLDQVAVPDFAAGAMENWGLVTYREQYLLYNPENSTTGTQTNIANIVAHEYTHQWFGNLVAIKWWTYLWLKEGFATLYSYEASDRAYPEWGIYQLFHASDYQGALTNDASASPRPMTHYVQRPSEISSLYDTVSYAKAGSVLRTWQHALSDEVFRRGLHNYLTTNQFSAADEVDLFTAIQTAAKENNHPLADTIPNMMSSWTRQGGYPLLTVTRDYNAGTFNVTQQAFFNNETLESEKRWYIPINYAVESNPDFRNTEATHYLLNVTDITVDAKLDKNEWLILNKQSTGYYRINYDEQNWDLIIDALKKRPHLIHVHNRAQLLHDAYRLSSSKRLNHRILLELLTYLPKEVEYAPWSTANGILNVWDRYLSGDADYDKFKQYGLELVNDIYNKLGVYEDSGEQHFHKLVRPIAINHACRLGSEACQKETSQRLDDVKNKGVRIEPNLFSTIYCNGLTSSNPELFDYVYNLYLSTVDQEERQRYSTPLGCSRNSTQIRQFIDNSIDESNNLKVQERTTILSAVYSRGEVGLLTSIEFLDENWQAYADLTPGFGGANPLDADIRRMSQYVVNAEQEQKLNALVDKVKDSEKVSTTLETAVKSNIKANFDWLDQNRDSLVSWVVTRYSGGSAAMNASYLSIAMALMVYFFRLI